MLTHYVDKSYPCARVGCNETLRPNELVQLHDGELFCSHECIAEWYMQDLSIKEVLLSNRKEDKTC